MFAKKYYSCIEDPIRNNTYTCKKFDNFFEADSYTLKNKRNSVCNVNRQIIEVCDTFPDFLKPLYLRYHLIKSKFNFGIRIEQQEKAKRRIFDYNEIPNEIRIEPNETTIEPNEIKIVEIPNAKRRIFDYDHESKTNITSVSF